MQISRQLCLLSISFLLSGLSLATEKPNFILVMCDDLGWGDVGFLGGTHIRTPHLDEMAESSLVLSRFYAQAPVCSPTRASLVTGRHHDRTGIYTANVGHLRDGEFTIYEALAAQGYATGHFGKWHMGTLTLEIKESNRGAKSPQHFSPPWQHGATTIFATEAKTPTYDAMWKPVKSKTEIKNFTSLSKYGWHQIPEGSEKKLYGTHYWTGEKEMVDPKSPELLGDDSKLIIDRTLDFVKTNKDSPFLAIVWFHAPHLPVVASKEDAASYDDGKTSGFEQNYYGCVTALDRAMGQLRSELRTMGIAENTVVAFCSDNGPEGNKKAPGSAGEFRGRKRSLYEGGVRVPGLIEWPAKIKKGMKSDVASCTVDYLPTVMDILNLEMPDQRPIDGVSLLPLIEGKMDKRPKPLAFHIQGKAAWHDGNLKAIRDAKPSKKKSGTTTERWELYDLSLDPSESNNLAAAQPEKLKAMVGAWTKWKASVDASDKGTDY